MSNAKTKAKTKAKVTPEMPFTEQDMRIWGYTDWRCLPDGTVIAVSPFSFTNGRLFWDVHQSGYEDFYCYCSYEKALESMKQFDPAVDKEPTGWHRHFKTGRRRPEGDASKQYINM